MQTIHGPLPSAIKTIQFIFPFQFPTLVQRQSSNYKTGFYCVTLLCRSPSNMNTAPLERHNVFLLINTPFKYPFLLEVWSMFWLYEVTTTLWRTKLSFWTCEAAARFWTITSTQGPLRQLPSCFWPQRLHCQANPTLPLFQTRTKYTRPKARL